MNFFNMIYFEIVFIFEIDFFKIQEMPSIPKTNYVLVSKIFLAWGFEEIGHPWCHPPQ